MSTQDEGKGAKGRSYEQITKDGTSSAGSMGSGATGQVKKAAEQTGGQQSAGRTDDLLSGNTTDQEAEEGFAGNGKGELQTGMEGIRSRSGSGAGNRQSGEQDAGSQGKPGGKGGADGGGR